MATQSDLRHILDKAVKDIERACKIRLGDEAQNIIKRLEEDIQEWGHNLDVPLPPRKEVQIWNNLTGFQRRLLDVAQNKFGIAIPDCEQSRIRDARDLESCGYITIRRKYETDKFVICHLTASGKKLLDANKGQARGK